MGETRLTGSTQLFTLGSIGLIKKFPFVFNGSIKLIYVNRLTARAFPVAAWPGAVAMQLGGDHSTRPGCDIISLKPCIDYAVMSKVN